MPEITTSEKFTKFWRFPLLSKITFFFFGIILTMVLAGLIFLLQMDEVFTTGEADFQSLELSQNLQREFPLESDAATKYFDSRDPSQVHDFVRYDAYIRGRIDSLLRKTGGKETHPLIEMVSLRHRQYGEFFRMQSEVGQVGQNGNLGEIMLLNRSLRDSVNAGLQLMTRSFQSSTLKGLRSFFPQARVAILSGMIVLSLAFVVASVLAIMLARMILKPIKALQAGTQKVGEGKYETVRVTSNDEVADLTRAFNMMSEKLRQLDELRMELMSEISHEMRTPLQVIKAGCYTIIHTKDGPALTQRQRDAVAMIHQSSNRINAFVNSFLDVAKMEAGLMKFNFEELKLVELLTPLVQEAQLIAQTRLITLEFLTGELPALRIDKERMTQLFTNLLSNALKYTPDNGKIAVRLSTVAECPNLPKNEKGCVRVEVQDTGVGIPESDLARLFDKFYQANNVPLVNEKGSGLGLALVKHVSEAHGGRVSVRSEVGSGSTFTVELPVS